MLEDDTDLFTIAPDYVEGVRRNGGIPVMVPQPDRVELDDLLDLVDGVVITGGNDLDPDTYGHDNTHSSGVRRESDDSDLLVAQMAAQRGMPILGICRGVQVVNVACGGTLHQEIQGNEPDHPWYRDMANLRGHRHDVELADGSRMADLHRSTAITVNSLHHQAVDEVGQDLVIAATSPAGVVEALESSPESDADIVAVQWHPEMLHDEGGDILFADLIERARRYRTEREARP
jgi:putative glutamine amidotransferase